MKSLAGRNAFAPSTKMLFLVLLQSILITAHEIAEGRRSARKTFGNESAIVGIHIVPLIRMRFRPKKFPRQAVAVVCNNQTIV